MKRNSENTYATRLSIPSTQVIMEFFRELRKLWGNQDREEEEGVISVEPITMIVPPELQDLPDTTTPESSPNPSTGGNSSGHHSSAPKGSSSKKMASEEKDGRGDTSSSLAINTETDVAVFEEWENK
ncbi:hypothetical protein SLA2020_154720 [Shorea laevis]